MEFAVDLEKWQFAWKSHWKSVKVIEKYQFEEVGYFFTYDYHVSFDNNLLMGRKEEISKHFARFPYVFIPKLV